MSYKISFRYNREEYTDDVRITDNRDIKSILYRRFEEKEIISSRIFSPSRNSIKVIFPSDEEVNKVMDDTRHFTSKGLHPKLSMSLKASRTIFCSGFDYTLLAIYNSEQVIKEHLESQNWDIAGIYILKYTQAFKIEFKTAKSANIFLNNTNTSIGAIKLIQEHKEREVDPTISQCWGCGILNPDHSSYNCHGTQVCLKCGSTEHKFYDCVMPMKYTDMTIQDRQARYCVPCGKRGDHTSLDHSRCPKKRAIIQIRARVAREKRKVENESNNRDLELIKSVYEYTNSETWPTLQTKQQSRTATIISLALLDEAVNKGIFQQKLSESLEANGIPAIKYKLEPNTARDFFNSFSGRGVQVGTQAGAQANIHTTQHKQNKQSKETPQPLLPQFSKYSRDQMGGKKAQNINMGLNNLFEDNGVAVREGRFKRNDTPYKIQVNTQTNDITLHDRGENEKGATAVTPEIIRETPDNWEDLDESISSQSRDLDESSSSINWDYSEDMHYQTINDSLNTKGDYISPTIKAISDDSLTPDYSTDLNLNTIRFEDRELWSKCMICENSILQYCEHTKQNITEYYSKPYSKIN